MRKEHIALKRFYESVGENYPEEEEVYTTLRGKLRRQFVLSRLAQFNGSLLDVGCNRGMYLLAYQGGARFGVDISRSVVVSRVSGRKPGLCAVLNAIMDQRANIG